jgi:hypothetical protein
MNGYRSLAWILKTRLYYQPNDIVYLHHFVFSHYYNRKAELIRSLSENAHAKCQLRRVVVVSHQHRKAVFISEYRKVLSTTDSHVLNQLGSVLNEPHFDDFLMDYFLVLLTIGQGTKSMRSFTGLKLIYLKNRHLLLLLSAI